MEAMFRAGGGRGYDIFPRTFVARGLLALAFVVGLPLYVAPPVLFVIALSSGLFAQADVTVENRSAERVTVYLNGFERGTLEPYEAAVMTDVKLSWYWGRDVRIENESEVLFEESLDLDDLDRLDYQIVVGEELPPCSTDDEREACRDAQAELLPDSRPSCEGVGNRVCFAPLGQIDPELVRGLVEYYGAEYGLEIGILTPSEAPWQFISPDRDQIEGLALTDYLETLFPQDIADPEVTLIGLTPLDMYTAANLDWRFALGSIDWSERPRAVISTYRMHLGSRGLVDEARVEERTRKLVTKYIGRLHYGIFPSDNPTSPMYDNILSVSDLDRMGEPLLVPVE
jgi:hypothetical protein